MDLDDSENDSDFVPEEEVEKGPKQKESINLDIASNKRKRKVNTIWDEIRKEDNEYVASKLNDSLIQLGNQLYEQPPKRIRLKIKKYFQKLVASNQENGEDEHIKESDQILKSTAHNKEEMYLDIRKRLQESVQKVKRKTVVVESRKFAGEEIQ
jgi:uncharacterized protein with NRDE domain